jgi:CheY-like chemotaxis protein
MKEIKQKHVLIIDNDPEVLNVLKDILNYDGYLVTAKQDVQDILSEISLCQPDLILIDYLLNGINGGELCGMIKRNEATSHLPVVLISAYGKILNSLGNYGCDAVIEKPFDLEDLSGTIDALINKHKIYK